MHYKNLKEKDKKKMQAENSILTLECKICHKPLKRLFDIIFSLLILILASPLFLLIALLVVITSRGPVFYSHLRVGRGGKLIYCYKFRTMIFDADKKLAILLQGNVKFKQEFQKYWKLKNDPRVTRFGKLLRKFSLDELPQFWNVLIGDLSVVGPRPVSVEEIKKYYGNKAKKILSVRPGLTGIWQTSGRNHLSLFDRVYLEEKYVDTQSFLKDLQLICKTIPAMFFSKGAF